MTPKHILIILENFVKFMRLLVAAILIVFCLCLIVLIFVLHIRPKGPEDPSNGPENKDKPAK